MSTDITAEVSGRIADLHTDLHIQGVELSFQVWPHAVHVVFQVRLIPSRIALTKKGEQRSNTLTVHVGGQTVEECDAGFRKAVTEAQLEANESRSEWGQSPPWDYLLDPDGAAPEVGS